MRRFTILILLLLVCAPLTPAAPQAGRPLQIETRHYQLWTDVEESLARDLVARMDSMYDEYERRFAGFAPQQQPEKLRVYIFARRHDYVRFTEDRLPNTGGIFIPSRKLLAAFLEGQGRDGLRRTLQHEAFHQFAFTVIGPNIPIWLNEGIAQVFEEGIWTGSSFILGQVPPRRVRQLQQDMRDRRLTEFRKLLPTSEQEWAAGMRDRTTASAQYNQAWAMSHFLIYANGGNGDAVYRGRVIQMLKLIREGAKSDDAFTQAFSDNITGFQQRFVEYARELRPTIEATYIENQSVLADLLSAMRIRGQTFDSIDAFREQLQQGGYRMQYSKGPLRWSTAEDVRIYFMDPQGRMMNSSQLFFQYRRGAPLSDIVCRALDGLQLQTRFHENGEGLEYEVLVEPRR